MTNQNDGVWIIDADARTLYANAAMADILALSPFANRGPWVIQLFLDELDDSVFIS